MELNLRNAYYRGLLAAKRETLGVKVEIMPSHMTPEEIVLYNRGLDDGRKRYTPGGGQGRRK